MNETMDNEERTIGDGVAATPMHSYTEGHAYIVKSLDTGVQRVVYLGNDPLIYGVVGDAYDAAGEAAE